MAPPEAVNDADDVLESAAESLDERDKTAVAEADGQSEDEEDVKAVGVVEASTEMVPGRYDEVAH